MLFRLDGPISIRYESAYAGLMETLMRNMQLNPETYAVCHKARIKKWCFYPKVRDGWFGLAQVFYGMDSILTIRYDRYHAASWQEAYREACRLNTLRGLTNTQVDDIVNSSQLPTMPIGGNA